MATLIKLKKGYDLKLQGGIVSDEVTPASKSALYAVIPDDFTGIVPRMEVKEGDTPEILQRRVMEQAEWILLPEATEKVAARIAQEKTR